MSAMNLRLVGLIYACATFRKTQLSSKMNWLDFEVTGQGHSESKYDQVSTPRSIFWPSPECIERCVDYRLTQVNLDMSIKTVSLGVCCLHLRVDEVAARLCFLLEWKLKLKKEKIQFVRRNVGVYRSLFGRYHFYPAYTQHFAMWRRQVCVCLVVSTSVMMVLVAVGK